MKKVLILILFLTNVFGIIYCQKIDQEVELKIQIQFETDWLYFRMLKNPLLPDTEKYVDRSRANPYDMLISKKIHGRGYFPYPKVSHWGEPRLLASSRGERYVNMGMPHLFLIEKGDGILYEKKEYFTDKVIDSININVYDSIFPYDNRFIVANDGFGHYTFHGGNIEWGDWKDVRFSKTIDCIGYVRGVQFGVDNVRYFDYELSERIRQARPDFPDYVYTEAHHCDIMMGRLLIGAPKGKEDRLIEFIYYCDNPAKTGDPDRSHLYEMRYIMPTNIKSISERHWEKRRLSDKEMETFYNEDNPLRYYVDVFIDRTETIIKK